MKNAQTTFGIILALILFSALSVQAEVALESNADVIGVWNLDGSAKDLESAKRPGQQTWEFTKKGKLATSGYDRRLPGGNFSVTSSYEVKGGKIVSDVPGRPGKTASYTVIEKDANSMILKQEFGEYLFFTKK